MTTPTFRLVAVAAVVGAVAAAVGAEVVEGAAEVTTQPLLRQRSCGSCLPLIK